MLHLYAIPLVFALVGLAFYTVLGGADFGAGFWQLTAGNGPQANAVRDHAHDAMAPVWEANHVWLVFVLTVVWTAYPTAFGSIASTLSIPLFVAAIGIIFRGLAYALRAGAAEPREQRRIDTAFSLSSLLTPFALGTAVGGIASRRVPVGNATGNELTSWINPTSLTIGVLAIASAAYLAAVFLAADAVKLGDIQLERLFRRRALAAGVAAGAVALAGLAILANDAQPVFHHLTGGSGLPALLASLLAGSGTLLLVWRRRYEPARYGAAIAVAAIIVGWGLSQAPLFLPGLTIRAAAAPRATLIALVVAVLAGALILFPSLTLLFRLVLSGRLAAGPSAGPLPRPRLLRRSGRGLLVRVAFACLLTGVGLLTVANHAWAHALGIACLLAFVVLAFPAALPPDLTGGTAATDSARDEKSHR